MDVKTIAVGTDFSTAAEDTASQAVALARHLGARVVLVHVGEVIELAQDHPELRQWGESAFRARREALAAAVERHSGQGVEISQVLHDGAPARGLCDAATELGADLIAVGSHGAGRAVARFLLGNVAEKVVRMSDRPVLVSRGKAGAGGFRKVLAAVDLGALSDRVVEHAVQLAAFDGEVELFHAWQLPSVQSLRIEKSLLLAELREARGARAVAALEQLLLRHRKPGVHIYFEHAEASSPRDAILDRLDAGDRDLLVAGSHGRRGVSRWLAGSVAEAVARAAPCPVVIVKP